MCAPADSAESALLEARDLLPTNVKPAHYELLLEPDLEQLTFAGTVTITLTINEPTTTITLNATELEIHSATISSDAISSGADFAAARIDLDNTNERLVIESEHELLPKTTATLTIRFTGKHNDLMVGFYRSRYTGRDGRTKNMASTHFEPTNARYAFPCWDEPKLRATFRVTLRVAAHLDALSNMDVEETRDADAGRKDVVFSMTPAMSTYLVAFVVGELDHVEAYTSGKHNGHRVRCRVYTVPGQASRGVFALDVAVKVLEYYAEVFGIAYPLPKLDQVAIPDFEIGAMENWGLVLYRQVALLVDKHATSTSARQQVAYVVSHELAHQWFGNLVALEWWSELWLKEGFATWVGTLAVDHVFPEYSIWTQFVVDELQRALALDAMRSSHPVQVPVRRSAEISQIFDAISYSKGASLIRMLVSYIGLDSFFKGVNEYLQKHKYANASTNDLWSALANASGLDIAGFMRLWTLTVGYPVVTVTENDTGDSVSIRQNRYLSSAELSESEDTVLWRIPLGVTSSAGSMQTDVLDARSTDIPLAWSSSAWYKLNSDTAGVFRVKYSENATSKLAAAMARGELSETDRIGIIADAAALAGSGHSLTSQFLELLNALHAERSYVVWQEVSARLTKLERAWVLEDSEHVKSALKGLRCALFRPLVEVTGWDAVPDEGLMGRLRALAVYVAGVSGDSGVVDEALRRFAQFFDDGVTIPGDMTRAVFAIAIANSTDARSAFENVKAYYLNAENPVDQRLSALSALGAAREPELVAEALEFALSADVRNQDLHMVLSALAANAEGRDKLWPWYVEHFDLLFERYRASTRYMGTLVEIVAGHFVGEDKAAMVKAFFGERQTAKFARLVEQTVEGIRSRTRWFEKDREDVRVWLENNGY